MEMRGNNLAITLLVMGLIMGGGIGYFMAPTGGDQYSQYELQRAYDEGYATAKSSSSSSSSYQNTEIADRLSGIETLVYGAIGASLVAALAAIVSLMQIARFVDR